MKRQPFCNSSIFFQLGVPSHSRDKHSRSLTGLNSSE